MHFPPDAIAKLEELTIKPTDDDGRFTGKPTNATLMAIWNGRNFDEHVEADSSAALAFIFDKTPMYAEMGGQVADHGSFHIDGAVYLIEDVQRAGNYVLHIGRLKHGRMACGASGQLMLERDRRDAIRANHSATHLLHAALRNRLGGHVTQKGSLVAPDRLRFDFTHFAPLTDDEIAEVERLVNEQTLRNAAVSKEEKSLDEALGSGAMALFGEKYSDRVRVVSVPGFSTELCGGTHVNATGDIGVFKIVSDSSIASGTRRIEAVTGKGAYERFQAAENLLAETAARLNTASGRLPVEVDRLQAQIREYQREVERLKLKLAQGGGAAADEVVEIAGVKLLVRQVESLGKDGRRQLGDSLTRKIAPGIVVIGDREEGKASILVMVSPDLVERIQAGKIVRAIPGARGGGKPDLAEGGVDGAGLAAALEAVPAVVRQLLNS